MLLLALSLTYSAYTLLCLSMPKHYRHVTGAAADHRRSRRLFRVGGWLLIALSFASCVQAAGWQFGPVQWVGLLAAAGVLLVFLLPYKPKTAAGLAVVAPLGALLVYWI
ncbi:MAG TPA: DUF3325 domain-containing protein [Gammaproteobacteria bacterium]